MPSPYTIKFSSALLVTLFILFSPFTGNTEDSKGYFPLYNAIIPNVSFWEKIYTKYSNDTIVVHDKDDIQKIYRDIPLPEPKSRRQRRANKRKTKAIQKEYANILTALRKRPAKTAVEKKVASFFTGPDRDKQLAKAAKQVRIQNGQRQRFRRSVIRSGAYIPIFKKIFRSYKLPEDLAYLPHVESSFNIGAYSKVGACGIWQFTKATGKKYLIIDAAVDQRLDPIAATHAAAKYFVRSYSKIKNWPLVITSYNYGIAGTIRAKEAFGSYTGVFKKHNTPTFGFASRNFYSEFVAAKNIAKKLEKKLPLQKPTKTCSMQLKGYVEIKDLLRHFSIGKKELKRLNPALRPAVFTGKKRITRNYTLHLPQTKAIKNRIASFPQHLYHKRQKSIRPRYYRVKRGDSLSSIAARFRVSIKSLQKINKMGFNSFIKAGQTLRIPPYEKGIKNTKKQRLKKKIPLLKKSRSKRLHT